MEGNFPFSRRDPCVEMSPVDPEEILNVPGSSHPRTRSVDGGIFLGDLMLWRGTGLVIHRASDRLNEGELVLRIR